MIISKLGLRSNLSDEWNFFSWGEGIGDTFDIKNECNTSKDPLLWWEFCLQLGGENVSVTSILSLVAWALVDVLVYLFDSGGDDLSSAVNDWHNGELFLWSRFFKLTNSSIPSSSFNLETEDVGTFFAWWKVLLPIELLKDIGLDTKLVELCLFLSGVDLLNGSQEGLWVEKSVQESALWSSDWVIFPQVQLVKSLLGIV